MRALKHYMIAAGLALPFLFLTSDDAAAQGRSGRGGGGNDGGGALIEFTAEISFSVGDREQIQAYYSSHPKPRDRSTASGHSKEPGQR